MDVNDTVQEYCIRGTPSVMEVGSALAVPIHPDRVLPFWVFAIVTKGRMPLQVGSHFAVVQTGQYYLLPPGIRHYGTETTPFDAVWFHFTCESEQDSASLCVAPQEVLLPAYGPGPPEINYLAWGNLLKQNLATGIMALPDVGVQLAAILGQVAAEGRKLQTLASPGAALARRALLLLLRNYREPITTGTLSSELGYTYGHIERVFRHHYSVTIRQKLAQIRIDEATALILMGKSLREAASETGFSDYYYFIRVFTKLKGTSPGRLAVGRRSR